MHCFRTAFSRTSRTALHPFEKGDGDRRGNAGFPVPNEGLFFFAFMMWCTDGSPDGGYPWNLPCSYGLSVDGDEMVGGTAFPFVERYEEWRACVR